MRNKITAYKTAYSLVAIVLLSILLTGCLREPGTVTENRIQVQEEKFFEKLPAADLNGPAVAGLARHYRKHGDGPVDLTVTYDPKSKTSGAMAATNEVARLTGLMRGEGMVDVNTNILPVVGSGPGMMAMVSYTSYNALAPKDCRLMDGYEDREDFNANEDYPLGCSVETMFARQIARPKDLKGRGVSEHSDGRRNANIIERYRTGAPNESLEGESASE